MTLTIVCDHPRLLLGMKKVGFGKGRWNGFGGKVEAGESIEVAAKREVLEEAGIKVFDIKKMGMIEFEFQKNSELLEVHIFKSENFLGEPRETEEMSPRWFFVDEIPFTEMWPDDRYWFPYFLRGKKFIGKFSFGDNDMILDYSLLESNTLI